MLNYGRVTRKKPKAAGAPPAAQNCMTQSNTGTKAPQAAAATSAPSSTTAPDGPRSTSSSSSLKVKPPPIPRPPVETASPGVALDVPKVGSGTTSVMQGAEKNPVLNPGFDPNQPRFKRVREKEKSTKMLEQFAALAGAAFKKSTRPPQQLGGLSNSRDSGTDKVAVAQGQPGEPGNRRSVAVPSPGAPGEAVASGSPGSCLAQHRLKKGLQRGKGARSPATNVPSTALTLVSGGGAGEKATTTAGKKDPSEAKSAASAMSVESISCSSGVICIGGIDLEKCSTAASAAHAPQPAMTRSSLQSPPRCSRNGRSDSAPSVISQAASRSPSASSSGASSPASCANSLSLHGNASSPGSRPPSCRRRTLNSRSSSRSAVGGPAAADSSKDDVRRVEESLQKMTPGVSSERHLLQEALVEDSEKCALEVEKRKAGDHHATGDGGIKANPVVAAAGDRGAGQKAEANDGAGAVARLLGGSQEHATRKSGAAPGAVKVRHQQPTVAKVVPEAEPAEDAGGAGAAAKMATVPVGEASRAAAAGAMFSASFSAAGNLAAETNVSVEAVSISTSVFFGRISPPPAASVRNPWLPADEAVTPPAASRSPPPPASVTNDKSDDVSDAEARQTSTGSERDVSRAIISGPAGLSSAVPKTKQPTAANEGEKHDKLSGNEKKLSEKKTSRPKSTRNGSSISIKPRFDNRLDDIEPDCQFVAQPNLRLMDTDEAYRRAREHERRKNQAAASGSPGLLASAKPKSPPPVARGSSNSSGDPGVLDERSSSRGQEVQLPQASRPPAGFDPSMFSFACSRLPGQAAPGGARAAATSGGGDVRAAAPVPSARRYDLPPGAKPALPRSGADGGSSSSSEAADSDKEEGPEPAAGVEKQEQDTKEEQRTATGEGRSAAGLPREFSFGVTVNANGEPRALSPGDRLKAMSGYESSLLRRLRAERGGSREPGAGHSKASVVSERPGDVAERGTLVGERARATAMPTGQVGVAAASTGSAAPNARRPSDANLADAPAASRTSVSRKRRSEEQVSPSPGLSDFVADDAVDGQATFQDADSKRRSTAQRRSAEIAEAGASRQDRTSSAPAEVRRRSNGSPNQSPIMEQRSPPPTENFGAMVDHDEVGGGGDDFIAGGGADDMDVDMDASGADAFGVSGGVSAPSAWSSVFGRKGEGKGYNAREGASATASSTRNAYSADELRRSARFMVPPLDHSRMNRLVTRHPDWAKAMPFAALGDAAGDSQKGKGKGERKRHRKRKESERVAASVYTKNWRRAAGPVSSNALIVVPAQNMVPREAKEVGYLQQLAYSHSQQEQVAESQAIRDGAVMNSSTVNGFFDPLEDALSGGQKRPRSGSADMLFSQAARGGKVGRSMSARNASATPGGDPINGSFVISPGSVASSQHAAGSSQQQVPRGVAAAASSSSSRSRAKPPPPQRKQNRQNTRAQNNLPQRLSGVIENSKEDESSDADDDHGVDHDDGELGRVSHANRRPAPKGNSRRSAQKKIRMKIWNGGRYGSATVRKHLATARGKKVPGESWQSQRRRAGQGKAETAGAGAPLLGDAELLGEQSLVETLVAKPKESVVQSGPANSKLKKSRTQEKLNELQLDSPDQDDDLDLDAFMQGSSVKNHFAAASPDAKELLRKGAGGAGATNTADLKLLSAGKDPLSAVKENFSIGGKKYSLAETPNASGTAVGKQAKLLSAKGNGARKAAGGKDEVDRVLQKALEKNKPAAEKPQKATKAAAGAANGNAKSSRNSNALNRSLLGANLDPGSPELFTGASPVSATKPNWKPAANDSKSSRDEGKRKSESPGEKNVGSTKVKRNSSAAAAKGAKPPPGGVPPANELPQDGTSIEVGAGQIRAFRVQAAFGSSALLNSGKVGVEISMDDEVDFVRVKPGHKFCPTAIKGQAYTPGRIRIKNPHSKAKVAVKWVAS